MPFDLATAQPVSSGFDLSTAQPVDQSPGLSTPPETRQVSGFDSFLRQTALQGRALGEGVTGALTLPNTIMTGAYNLPRYAANKLLGTNYPYRPTLQQVLSQSLTAAGAPTPQTSGEQLASAATQGVSSALAGGGAAGMTGLNAVRAGASGLTGGVSAEVARQAGLPAWMQLGAGLVGGQLPALGESTARTIGDLAAPITTSGQQRAVGTFLNDQATNPVQALQNLRASGPIVPNSMPTAGAESRDVGLLGVEKAMRGISPAPFGERLSLQNVARQAELTDMAGTPGDLTAAIAARSGASSPLYATAAKDSAPIDNEMIALMQRPSMQAAIMKAKQLAEEKGQAFGMSSNAPGGPMSLSGQDLQGIKMALDDMKTTGFTQGIGSHQAGAMQDTLDSLKDWMQRNVPSQRAADATFQAYSAPINRMQTLQELQQRSNLTAADMKTGQYFMNPTAFSRGLDKVKADPFSGVNEATMARLEALRKDLQNSQAVNGPLLKAPGSDTFQNLSLKQNLGSMAKVGGKFLEIPYRLAGADAATNELLTKAQLDPQFAADLMQKAAIPRSQLNFRPYDIGTFFGIGLPGLPSQR